MANTKGSALPAMTTPVGSDLLIAVDNPGGTPATQKVTFANAWTNYFKGQADSFYSALGHTHAPGDISGGAFADGLIAASSVTQHQAALSITESQISDLTHNDAAAIHDNVSAEISVLTEKVTPVSGDHLIIEDSAAANAKKRVQIGNLPGGTDADAIHDNVSGEISIVTAKSAPADGDFILIEDSAAANSKKSLTVLNLWTGSHKAKADALYFAKAGSAEISSLTEKTTPVGADHVLLEDSAASNAKKRMTLSNSWDNFYRAKQDVCFIIAASDETTALTTGTAKATFRVPHAVTLTDIRASVATAPTGGPITVDVNDGVTSIMTTNKIMIDATEKTSEGATTQPSLTDTALADDAEITIDIDAVGSTIAGAGLKVTLIGTRI